MDRCEKAGIYCVLFLFFFFSPFFVSPFDENANSENVYIFFARKNREYPLITK